MTVGDPQVSAAPALRRLDAELVRRGLARSRDQAAELIASGVVTVGRTVARKPSTRITETTRVRCSTSGPAYVSRGADKLAGAIADLAPAGLEVSGRRCLDAGASTGGFTQVLLHHGAHHVVAVDVGSDQLAPALRSDERIEVLDGINVRDLLPEAIGGPVDLVVADLSFISLTVALEGLAQCVAPDGDLLLMVKPQFEVGRGRVGPGGVVREPALHVEAVEQVAAAAGARGLGVRAATRSRRPGPAGNLEYFLWLRADAPPPRPGMFDLLVETGDPVLAASASDRPTPEPQ